MKANTECHHGRPMNILFISMQIINPIIVCCVSILYLAQEVDFFGMIKGYVALGFILNIDDLFSGIFPQILKDQP